MQKYSRRRSKPPAPKFEKLDHDYIRSLGVTKKPTLDYRGLRGGSVRDIPSLAKAPGGACSTTSVMDPMSLQKESAETQAAILAKSRRIAIAYNKGAYQYVTDETDTTAIGKKNIG